MNKTVNQKIRTLKGNGEIYKSDEYICRGYYSLEEWQEFVIIETSGGTDKLPGLINYSGRFTVDPSERTKVLNTLNSGEVFTLHLERNQLLDVILNPVDPINGIYSLSPAATSIPGLRVKL